MAVPDDVTVSPPVVIAGSAPGAPATAPLDARLGAAEGAAAAARPAWVRPTPTSRPAARLRGPPTPRNRDALDMAGYSFGREPPRDRRVRTSPDAPADRVVPRRQRPESGPIPDYHC